MREFGWTPAEVRAIPLPEIMEILMCLHAETAYQNRPKGKTAKTA
jgi:hypothetical protein